ncbi:hypothetical protein TNCV_3921871 [Trichonephila clavipes]|nr:hypothetical protein TNCV_3921871 [Trichonephila clavipes]
MRRTVKDSTTQNECIYNGGESKLHKLQYSQGLRSLASNASVWDMEKTHRRLTKFLSRYKAVIYYRECKFLSGINVSEKAFINVLGKVPKTPYALDVCRLLTPLKTSEILLQRYVITGIKE